MSLMPAFKIGLWNAWLFMSVFLIQMIAMLFADKRIQEKSHVPKEARINRCERNAGLIGNLIWLLAVGYSVFLPLQIGTIWFFIGLSVFIIGLALLVLATFNFMTTPANQLITKGAYNISRNPMYLATFFICLGAGIAAASWIFLFLSVIMALCFYLEALIEERYCLNRYSDAYMEYMSRSPRWIGVPRKHNK